MSAAWKEEQKEKNEMHTKEQIAFSVGTTAFLRLWLGLPALLNIYKDTF